METESAGYAEELLAEMREAGVSQVEVSEMLGLNRVALYRVLRREVTAQEAERIRDAVEAVDWANAERDRVLEEERERLTEKWAREGWTWNRGHRRRRKGRVEHGEN